MIQAHIATVALVVFVVSAPHAQGALINCLPPCSGTMPCCVGIKGILEVCSSTADVGDHCGGDCHCKEGLICNANSFCVETTRTDSTATTATHAVLRPWHCYFYGCH